MRIRTLATISIGLLSAACQGSYSQNTPSAAAPAYVNTSLSASAACADYGFRSGTTSFDQCVSRERQARAAGRMNRDYAAVQLTADARNACSSYGLAVATASYDRCVSARSTPAAGARGRARATPPTTPTRTVIGSMPKASRRRQRPSHRRQGSVYPGGAADLCGPVGPAYRMTSTTIASMRGLRVDSTGHRMPSKARTTRRRLRPLRARRLARRIRQPLRRAGQSHRCRGRVVAMPASRY